MENGNILKKETLSVNSTENDWKLFVQECINYMKSIDLKNLFTFLRKRPNRLIAYLFFLAFITILYWLSKSTFIIGAGLGAAAVLFPSFND